MIATDLKLLAVFAAIYDHRSVSKAARRLNLTQSAVSHALRRLRDSIGDPLFVRSGGALQPTSRAQEMAPAIRDGLARLQAALAPTEFNPETASRTFTIAAASYFCALLIPNLIARAREVAPGVRLRIVALGSDLLANLDEENVDLALGAFGQVPHRLTAEPLFREDLVWIASRAGSVRAPVSSEMLARNPHLVIATRLPSEPARGLLAQGPLEAIMDQSLHANTLESGAAAIVYDALTAAAVVAQTDMVALVPRRLALSEEERLGLCILEPERDHQGIDLVMVTHSRTSADAGLAWLRAQVADLSGSLERI